MVNETPVAPAPAAPEPVVAPAPAPEALLPAPAPAATPPANAPDWATSRIDRLTADKRELERQLLAARNGGAPVPVGGSPPPPAPASVAPPLPAVPVMDAAAVEREALRIADNRDFQRKVTSIGEEGLKAHPQDWAPTMLNLQRISALDADLVNIAADLGSPHELIYALGQNMNEAARIASLPPGQKGAALAQFQNKMLSGSGTRISGAPPPVPNAVDGNPPTSNAPSDKDSMDQWIEKRRKTSRRFGGNAQV